MPSIAQAALVRARTFKHWLTSFVRPTLRNEPLGTPLGADIAGTYVVATKRGLYLLRDGALTRVLAGNFYGVTRAGDALLVFENCTATGRILELGLTQDLRVSDVRRLYRGLSPGCHQIDLIDGRLFVADAYNNRMLAMDLETDRREAFYPLGTLSAGRGSPNYAHMNSVYRDRDRLYVLCHNESAKTGRFSEVLVLDARFQIADRIATTSRSAHNVAAYRGVLYHCDSLGNALKAGDEPIFAADHFTRGLSISDDYILVGGSEYARREDRERVHGYVYVLKDGELQTSFPMPGMVQEIRRLDAPDYGLSAFAGRA